MAISKVTLNGTTLMDATTATAAAADITAPKTAMLANGVVTTGTGSGGGGGGGATLVASGEFIGPDTTNGRTAITIGNKMAIKDFYVLINAKDGELPRDTYYTIVAFSVFCPSAIGSYTFGSTGDATFVPAFSVDDNNDGTITTVQHTVPLKSGVLMRNGAMSDWIPSTFITGKSNDGFYVYFGQSNSSYKIPSTLTYEYQIVYFGDSPNTDVIEIS